ncbi:P protein-like isoform X1 [Lytechinus variegatus]|uniref:P protein-like isoform X1 n=1 Tax=Lytechinus variegatus TaxID=7654 RepID=UPI001BB17EF6|nr:P protein-like isoform X1 [Lytechinus variegatus]XP_041460376.1 P protein-like isoform X1 [Lytechinus variegatus]
MEDEGETKGLLDGNESKSSHGSISSNGHSILHSNSVYKEMESAVDDDNDDDHRFETSQRTSFSWDKMLLDDLAYDDGDTSNSKFKRMLSRCKPSNQTKLYLRYTKIAVLFLSMFVCTVFFTLKDEVLPQLEIFSISQDHPYSSKISDLGSNVIIKVSFKGPIVELGNSTENITVRLVGYDYSKGGAICYEVAEVYNVYREYPLSESIYWEEMEKKYHDLKEGCGHNTSYELQFESNIDDLVTMQTDHTLLPSSSNEEVVWAAIILVAVYVLIGFELVHRTTAAMIGSFATLAVLTSYNERPPLEVVMSWLDYDVLALLWGMMTIVAIFSETGFFDYCALLSYKWAKGKIWTLVTILCLFSGIVSAFLDNVTTILLMTPVTISLCEVLNIDPRHVLIAEVIFSNIGGTATAIGDPPNVIIVANSEIEAAKNRYPYVLGIGFSEFTLHLSLGIVFCMIVGYGALRLLYRRINLHSLEPPAIRELKHEIEVWRQAAVRIMVASKEENTVKALLLQKVSQLETQLRNQIYEQRHIANENLNWKEKLIELEQRYRITDSVLLAKCSFILIVTILLFFIHSAVDTIYLDLGWIAVIGAVALLVLADVHDIENVMHRVEWATLLFFAALFVLMEGLTELGLIEYIGNFVAGIIEDVPPNARLAVALILILWVSALASSFIDNIPFTTAMIPIILDLAEREELELPLQPLVWALAFGACLGGNGTLIGASANVVCAGIADQHGYGFTFFDFFKVGFPMMLCTTFVAMIYLLICHVAFEWH